MNSVDPNIFVNAINRLSDYVQRNGGVKALQTEEYNRMFVDEIQSAVQEAAQSLDQNTLAKVEKDPFFKQLADSADKSENFKKIAQNAQNVTPAQLVSTLTDMTKEVLQIAGGATGSATGGATGGALGAIAGALGGILPGIINVILGGISSLLGGVGGSLGGGTLGTIGGGLGGTVGGGILGSIGGTVGGGTLGTIGGAAVGEGADWLERFLSVVLSNFNLMGLLVPTLGAVAYGAVSAFVLNALAMFINGFVGLQILNIIPIIGPMLVLIGVGIDVLFSIFVVGIAGGFVGGIGGLLAGIVGTLLMRIVNLFEGGILPIPTFDHTFWTIGGAALITVVAVFAEAFMGGIAGLLLPVPLITTFGASVPLGILLGAAAGLIVGGGVGLIALSKA